MPVDFDEEEAGGIPPQVRVAGSIAAEIDSLFTAACNTKFRGDHPTYRRIYAEGSELEARVLSLWGSDEVASGHGGSELAVLAHHGGILLSLDPDLLLGRLEALCSSAPAELPLASETPSVRRVILRRLELLRSSPEVRRRFVELVNDLWAAVSDDWRRHGRSAVEAMIAGRRELQRRGALWREVARTPHKPWHDAVLGLVNRLGPDGVVAVVPTYFAHIGFYLDLPGTVMLGLGAYTGHLGARERSEALARRLRSISDPTRLAMLESLRGEPGTVTELAERLSLAQPTVSNHVKVLREADLVGIEPGEGRRRLVVRPEAVRDLMLHLGEALDVPGLPVGEEGQPGQ